MVLHLTIKTKGLKMNINEARNITRNCINRTELKPLNTDKKSFYKKAWIIETEDGMTQALISYTSIVAIFNHETEVLTNVNSATSPTTMRHYNEFLMQCGVYKAIRRVYECEKLRSFVEFKNRIEQIDLKNEKYKVFDPKDGKIKEFRY